MVVAAAATQWRRVFYSPPTCSVDFQCRRIYPGQMVFPAILLALVLVGVIALIIFSMNDIASRDEESKERAQRDAETTANNERLRRERIETERPKRIALAEQINYAGLRFDGVYRTLSPIIIDSDCHVFLSLQFRRDLIVDYCWRQSDGEEVTGSTDYTLHGESKVQFSFWVEADNYCLDTEWEGALCDEQLRLTFYHEIPVFGNAPHWEGETTLRFFPSSR